jgi:hypothetical protein
MPRISTKLKTVFMGILIVGVTGSYGIAKPKSLKRTKELRGAQAPLEISVDVSGIEVLDLVATGYSWGQAVWAEPVLVAQDGSVTSLLDLKPISAKVSWGSFTQNKGPDGKALTIANQQFSKGLFAHADSRLLYRLNAKYVRFKAWVGINHTAGRQGKVVFEVRDGSGYELERRFQKAKAVFTRPVLAEIRQLLISVQRPDREQLQALTHYVEAFDAIHHGLEAEDANELAQAEAFVAFARTVYLSQLDAPLLFVKRHEYWAAHIYDDFLTWHPGGGIYILENPAAPAHERIIRPLIDPGTHETLGPGVYRDPDLSWDGKRVLFAFKGEANGDTSIYEIDVNGQGLRRLTNPSQDRLCLDPQPGLIGAGHHDITPCYLPSGRIAFTSTRTGGHVMCFSSYIDTLHTMNADGSDLRSISVNNQNEFDPAVLPDGRVLYGRWEYVDKTALYMQSLWMVNPDGTNETALFANNLAKPTALLDARPVPGSELIVAALTPHNGQAVGAIAMLDPKRGKNDLQALTNFTAEYPTEMDQGLRQGPCDPWALSEDLVLISNNDEKHGAHGVIELLTRAGFRTVVHRDPDITCYAPMLVKPRKSPPVKPSLLRPGVPGTFMVHDIYRGMDNVQRGDVKWLRILETTSRISGIPPGGRWWNQAFLVSWQGSYDIKKILGVVPVEKDGSAYFEAPAGQALYFQALDSAGRLIQSQRTFVQSAPGVTRSCTGCHVKDDDAAPLNRGRIPRALARQAAKIRPEAWGAGFIDYPSMIQPILDRHCVKCHGGPEGIQAGIDLSGGWTWAFNISYESLIKNTLTGFLNCNNGSVHTADILPPRAHGSGAAPLTKLLLDGHEGRIQQIKREEVALVLAWMDGNCNYYGTWDYTEHATCNTLLSVAQPLLEEMKHTGCVKCHEARIGNDWINLQDPEYSRILRAPLTQGIGFGLQWCRQRKARPIDMPLVDQHIQPPDVARPAARLAPDPAGQAVISFADTQHPSYRAMLKIIRQIRTKALETPRVDMPGANPVRGKCRQLPPIAPPVVARYQVRSN